MRQLHVLATLLSWHMAKACHDLGDESSAMMHARAAGVSAEQAGHPALSALVHGLKSLISYWSAGRGRPVPRTQGRRGVTSRSTAPSVSGFPLWRPAPQRFSETPGQLLPLWSRLPAAARGSSRTTWTSSVGC
ncbi:hypothetical protein ACIP6I_37380 [Streptomyces anulatus]